MKRIIKRFIPKKIINKIDEILLNRVKNKLRNTECKYKIYTEDKKKLSGKVAIVTGGSGALGSAICYKFVAEGAIVGVCGRSKETVNPVVDKINSETKELGGVAVPIILDVTKEKDIEETISTFIKEYNKIDILINNAGGNVREGARLIIDQDIKVIDRILNTNLRGTIICSKMVAKYMTKQRQGKIINIGSVIGAQGQEKNCEYAAAKEGIVGFTKSLAIELAPYGINVNCVSPGMIEQIIFDKPIQEIKTNKNYIGRYGKTEDVANLVEFLVSDESSYITGQNIIIDGGRTLGLKGE